MKHDTESFFLSFEAGINVLRGGTSSVVSEQNVIWRIQSNDWIIV